MRSVVLLTLSFLLACNGEMGTRVDPMADASELDSGAAEDGGDNPESDAGRRTDDAGRVLDDAGRDRTDAGRAAVDAGSPVDGGGSGFSLRFYGNGGLDDDRVKIRIDDPPGPTMDVGGADFTIEFFLRGRRTDNPNTITCGNNNNWVSSNIVIDRDRHSQPSSYGIGLANGVVIFNVTGRFDGSYTLCGTTTVLDDAWHHIAVQRRFPDGRMQIFVDGSLDASVDGPDGDISYPDDGEPIDVCPGGLCDYSDPFVVFGAEKHGYGDISFNGYLDEVRFSTSLRYAGSYSVPTSRFATDGETVGLFHFDEGGGARAFDASGEGNDGQINRGGDPVGPDWTGEEAF